MARPNRPRTIGSEANLAQRVEYERKQRGWSYEALATRMTDVGCPIPRSALQRIERGDPPRKVTVDELIALSEVFGLEVGDLLTPMELLRKQRAHEILETIERHEQTWLEANGDLIEAWTEFWELAADDLELHEFVSHRLFDGEPGEPHEGTVELIGATTAAGSPLRGWDPEPLNTALADLLRTIVTTTADVVEASLATDQENDR